MATKSVPISEADRVLAAERTAHGQTMRRLGEAMDMLDMLTDSAILGAHYLLDEPPKSNAREQGEILLMVARDAAALLGKEAPCSVCGSKDPESSRRHAAHAKEQEN